MAGLAAAALAGALMTSASWAATATESTFLKEAIQGSIAEVKLGQLAQQNGGSDKVRQFVSQLVTDHSASKDQADALAKSLGASVPDQPSASAQKEYKRLQSLTGAQFDKEFAKHEVMDHEKDIREFEKAAKSGNGQVAQFAQATLPTLRHHLEMAKNLEQ
jgi:putative membrane protein